MPPPLKVNWLSRDLDCSPLTLHSNENSHGEIFVASFSEIVRCVDRYRVTQNRCKRVDGRPDNVMPLPLIVGREITATYDRTLLTVNLHVEHHFELPLLNTNVNKIIDTSMARLL